MTTILEFTFARILLLTNLGLVAAATTQVLTTIGGTGTLTAYPASGALYVISLVGHAEVGRIFGVKEVQLVERYGGGGESD